MVDLSAEERQLIGLLIYMTGREERLTRSPLADKEQIASIQAIWPILKSPAKRGMEPQARCDLLNRLLLSLGINPASLDFFNVVFGEVDFSDFDRLGKQVNRFRTLSMLEYGNFRFGYRQFREGTLLKEKWRKYFPTNSEVSERARQLRSRADIVGLVPIPGSQLFSLGYLASEYAPKINGARKQLITIINSALETGVTDFRGLQEVSKKLGFQQFTSLLAKAGIPGTEALIYPDLPLFGGGKRLYSEILLSLRESCITVDEEAIARAREAGLQNARTYMAMHDLDVYLATSMRDPLHFTTNWAFVQRLFHTGELAEWRLHYFDPTQAFLKDRIQKGLLECLMIKRAQLSVYNAQEADTFGKDAEAGVTLAQGKPVIIYVARLFEHHPDLQTLYRAIDEGARIDRDPFVDRLVSQGLFDSSEKDALLGPEKTKADAVAAVINKHAPVALRKSGEDQVAMELIRQGYDPERIGKDLVEAAVERILLLERRALIFRDVHPLSLQTSPMDGVARGVIVTRTVDDSARVISGLFLGTLQYEIVEDEFNWLLVDQITRSPVRVVTKDPILTTSFWSEDWSGSEK